MAREIIIAGLLLQEGLLSRMKIVGTYLDKTASLAQYNFFHICFSWNIRSIAFRWFAPIAFYIRSSAVGRIAAYLYRFVIYQFSAKRRATAE
jgi:hypothetical protein